MPRLGQLVITCLGGRVASCLNKIAQVIIVVMMKPSWFVVLKVDCIWGRVLAEKGKRSILPIASRVTFAFYSSWKFEFLLFVSRSHHTNLLLFLALRNMYSTWHKDYTITYTALVGLACYGQIWRLLVRPPTPDNDSALCPIDWNGGSLGGENLFLLILFLFFFLCWLNGRSGGGENLCGIRES